jgi:succinate dehydrogenase / fumarate reductase cytochrome b subunit
MTPIMSTRVLTLTNTTIGKKMVMAASGAILFGFVIVHMLGNLQVFIGPEALNEYSKKLHDMPALLYGARAVLLLAVAAHIVTSLQLTMANKAARPIGYQVRKDVATSYAARTMVWSGPILLLYIVYHIAHLTVGYTKGIGYQHDRLDAQGMVNVYQNVVDSFRVPWVTAIYVVAQLALSLHLYHGAWSLFQSLGLNHKRYNETLRSSAVAIAVATCVGFVAVPIAIFLKLGPFADVAMGGK